MTISGQLEFALSASIAIIPSAALIYWLLKNVYEMLDEKKLYFMFGIALICGVILALFQTYIVHEYYIPVRGGDLFSLIILAFLFSMFDNLIKIVMLNLKRYKARPTTTFYGVSFAVMGSMVAALQGYRYFQGVKLFSIIQINANNTTVPYFANEYYSLESFFVLTFAVVFYHGALGIYNGHYSSLGKFWKVSHMMKVIAISYPFNVFLFWWYLLGDTEMLVIALIYSGLVLFFIIRKQFMMSLPEKEREEMGRKFPWKRSEKKVKKEKKGRSKFMDRLREIEEKD